MPLPVGVLGNIQPDQVFRGQRIPRDRVFLVFPHVGHDIQDVEDHPFLRAHRRLATEEPSTARHTARQGTHLHEATSYDRTKGGAGGRSGRGSDMIWIYSRGNRAECCQKRVRRGRAKRKTSREKYDKTPPWAWLSTKPAAKIDLKKHVRTGQYCLSARSSSCVGCRLLVGSRCGCFC